jgi:phenylpropionate dioxygenase-like ring-hydroxylating dioxygenase large terminal subunit
MNPRYPSQEIPSGWFAVAMSDELRPGGVLPRTAFGRELVVFRTEQGAVHVLDAHCPHLGAHLGHGGKVQGEVLRCPFHAFCFDGKGQCVSTPYGTKIPPRARLRTWPVQERNGMVLVYHDPTGAVPTWEVPALDVGEWSRPLWKRFDLRSHPQETSENSVDLGHLTVIHTFNVARTTREVATDGPVLTARYAVERSLDFLGMPGRGLSVEFDVAVYGLGVTRVETKLPGLQAELRQWVLSTPVDSERMQLSMVSSIRNRSLPLRFVDRLLLRLVFLAMCHEVKQDFPIWENKVYCERPALALGDGPIGPYRRWARQFYRHMASQQPELANGSIETSTLSSGGMAEA